MNPLRHIQERMFILKCLSYLLLSMLMFYENYLMYINSIKLKLIKKKKMYDYKIFVFFVLVNQNIP